MRIFAKTSTRSGYLFGLLPSRFVEKDSYKNNPAATGYTEEGLLERFLEIFCLEIDNELSPYIDDIGLLVDASQLPNLPHDDTSKFLIPLAADLGNPPDIGTEDQYKTLLINSRLINQHKGSKEGVSLFLAVFGYEISDLTQSEVSAKSYDATPTVLKYDSGLQYDAGFIFYSGWDLIIADVPGTGTKNPTQDFLDSLKEAIQKFISPVFATLGTVTYV